MKTGVMPVGHLSVDQMRSVLLAATTPPPLGSGPPWRFHCTPETIELYADPAPAAHDTGPEHQDQILNCGAALLNLRLAIRAHGVYPEVRLLPEAGRPDLLAIVRPHGREPATPVDKRLADAVHLRRSHRRPFLSATVIPSVQRELRRAAEIERAWLATVLPPQLPQLREIMQRAWSTRPGMSGTPGRQESQLTDLGARPDGLLVVIGSLHDGPLSSIQAGQAMQRVLLTASTAGFSAAFLPQVVTPTGTRRALRQLLGGGLWPQVMLQLGHGEPVPEPLRAPLEDVVTSDERPFSPSLPVGVPRGGAR